MGQNLFSQPRGQLGWWHSLHLYSFALLPHHFSPQNGWLEPRREVSEMVGSYLTVKQCVNMESCKRHAQTLFRCCHQGVLDSMQLSGILKAIFRVIQSEPNSRSTIPWIQRKGTNMLGKMHYTNPISALSWIIYVEQAAVTQVQAIQAMSPYSNAIT